MAMTTFALMWMTLKLLHASHYVGWDLIKGTFLVKSDGPPSYYLGNDYNWSAAENASVLSCSTYIKECIWHLEDNPALNGKLFVQKVPAECHLELDDSPLLDDNGTQQYQMLIGMAQWACTFGCLDIAFAVSSLSQFSANPCEGHLNLAMHVFGYLKKHPNCCIVLNSAPLECDDAVLLSSFDPDFLKDYPDVQEQIDPSLPTPYGIELQTSIFFDADHAHDHVMCHSITGLILFVGSTPVHWI